MAKRRRKLSTRVKISIDEFERNDLTLVAAVIFNENSIPRFLREWRVLQQTIRSELRRKYPFAQKPEMQSDSWLPEIHAKELYQSQKIFRNDEEKYPGYWKQHRKWIGEAVAIIRRAQPAILSIPFGKHLADLNRKMLGLPTETWASDVPYKNMRDKMDRLFKSQYVWALHHMIDALEIYLDVNGMKGDLVCDEHGDGYGFSQLRIFEIAAREMNVSRLPSPVFASSETEPLLQAADVVAYIFGGLFEGVKSDTLRPDIEKWALELIPLESRLPKSREIDMGRSTARIIEYLIRTSGGPKPYQDILSAQIEDFVGLTLTTQDIHMYLGPDGLQFGIGPQMYKPPSEDGDLSELSVPNPIGDDKAGGQDS